MQCRKHHECEKRGSRSYFDELLGKYITDCELREEFNYQKFLTEDPSRVEGVVELVDGYFSTNIWIIMDCVAEPLRALIFKKIYEPKSVYEIKELLKTFSDTKTLQRVYDHAKTMVNEEMIPSPDHETFDIMRRQNRKLYVYNDSDSDFSGDDDNNTTVKGITFSDGGETFKRRAKKEGLNFPPDIPIGCVLNSLSASSRTKVLLQIEEADSEENFNFEQYLENQPLKKYQLRSISHLSEMKNVRRSLIDKDQWERIIKNYSYIIYIPPW